MDPNATLARLLAAQLGGDAEAAVDAARDLYEWLGRSGFPPSGWIPILPRRPDGTLCDSWAGVPLSYCTRMGDIVCPDCARACEVDGADDDTVREAQAEHAPHGAWCDWCGANFVVKEVTS